MSSSTKQPLVTVLIPVYNRPCVTKTIRSILDQTYENLEILIVDNASTDNTVETIKGLNDKRIRIVVNEVNRGQTYSMNRGLDLARGKYIARIDSDDLALPTRIEKQVRYMEEHPECVLVGSHIRLISDDDILGPIMKMPISYDGFDFTQTFCCAMHHPAAMYRTDVIRNNKVYYDKDITMAEDYEMWRLLTHYGRACNLDEILVYYRRGLNNDSIKHLKEMLKESRTVRRRVCEELDLPQKDKTKLFKMISISEETNQSIFKTIKYLRFMLKMMNRSIDKNSSDYPIVKFHVVQKAYGSCVKENKRLYAKLFNRIYNRKKKSLYNSGEKYDLYQ